MKSIGFLVSIIAVLSLLLVGLLASCKNFTKANITNITHNLDGAKALYCSELLDEKRQKIIADFRKDFPWVPEEGFICSDDENNRKDR